ncbi:competence protein CoiA family protein [Paenibacillus abyssi]
MSKGGSLFCPDCHGQMVFRAGDVKITHFAHKKACSLPLWRARDRRASAR